MTKFLALIFLLALACATELGLFWFAFGIPLRSAWAFGLFAVLIRPAVKSAIDAVAKSQ